MKTLFLLAAIVIPSLALPLASRAQFITPHDHFADARIVAWPASAGAMVTSSFQVADATAETGEPAHGGSPASSSVWWKFIPDASGAVVINRTTDQLISTTGFYQGASLETLSPLLPINHSLQVYPVVAGTTYMVAINYHTPVSRLHTLQLKLTRLNLVQYANDNFASRTGVGLGGVSFSRYPTYHSSGHNWVAWDTWFYGSNETGEPLLAGQPLGDTETIWWEFTAPKTDWYDFIYNAEVFTGSTLETLQVAVPTQMPFNSAMYFHLEAGQKLVFRSVVPKNGSDWSYWFYAGKADRYDLFRYHAHNAGLPSGQDGHYGNPTKDGVNNMLKFLLGLDPTKTYTSDPRSSHLPKLEKRGDGRMEVVFTLDVEAANQLLEQEQSEFLFICPAISTDMKNWMLLDNRYLELDETTRFREFRYLLPENLPQMFIRLEVQFRDYEGSS